MAHDTSAPRRPPAGSGASTTDPPVSRARRVAFRVLAVLLTLWMLAISVFGLTEIVLMWLPERTVGDLVSGGSGDELELTDHRTHFFMIGLAAWGTLLALLVQLRRPERRVAPMLLLVVSATTALVVFGLHGTVTEWLVEEWTWFVPAVVLALLHPARHLLLTWPGHDRVQLGLAAVAAVPWLSYALVSASRQITRSGGEHAADEHWAIVAWVAVLITAAAVIGATRHRGWQLPAWYAAIASILLGLHALVFPGLPSALWPVAAVAAIVWGAAYAASIVARTRRTASA